MKILDTDHCVALLRGRLGLNGRIGADEELAVTAITVGELAHGVYSSARLAGNLASLDLLLARLVILPFDEGPGLRFGLLKANLEKAGKRLSDPDLQIAAVAMQYRSPLITHNRRHFERIPDLAIEDWLE